MKAVGLMQLPCHQAQGCWPLSIHCLYILGPGPVGCPSKCVTTYWWSGHENKGMTTSSLLCMVSQRSSMPHGALLTAGYAFRPQGCGGAGPGGLWSPTCIHFCHLLVSFLQLSQPCRVLTVALSWSVDFWGSLQGHEKKKKSSSTRTARGLQFPGRVN